LKQQLNPAVAGIIVVIILAVVGFFVFKGTGGGGDKAPGSEGNKSPFGVGGPATKQMMDSGSTGPKK